ncbi:MAG: SDR family oxidoreductase, partial [Asticcacaulis sp.]
MKAVVIGQSGQLAQNLARLSGQALASGLVPELTCLGRAHCDLMQPETVARIIAEASADLVINAAAYTAVDKAESEQAACTALNHTGVAALAQACARKGVPLIHVSTDMVFDGHKSGDYVETDPIAPLSHYGRTKSDGEAAVRAALVDHLIVRVSWVYSPFGENFLTAMMRLASSR